MKLQYTLQFGGMIVDTFDTPFEAETARRQRIDAVKNDSARDMLILKMSIVKAGATAAIASEPPHKNAPVNSYWHPGLQAYVAITDGHDNPPPNLTPVTGAPEIVIPSEPLTKPDDDTYWHPTLGAFVKKQSDK